MFQLVISISWNLEGVGSNRCVGKEVQAGKQAAFLLSLSLYRPPAEGVAQIKGVDNLPWTQPLLYLEFALCQAGLKIKNVFASVSWD